MNRTDEYNELVGKIHALHAVNPLVSIRDSRGFEYKRVVRLKPTAAGDPEARLMAITEACIKAQQGHKVT